MGQCKSLRAPPAASRAWGFQNMGDLYKKD
jgi:hypothetical protein